MKLSCKLEIGKYFYVEIHDNIKFYVLPAHPKSRSKIKDHMHSNETADSPI